MKIPSTYHTHKARAIDSFYRFSEGEEFPQSPLEVFLEVSNLCDLQCAMCCSFSGINPHRLSIIKNQKREFFDFSNIENIAPYLQSALRVHAFGYGEPTIHPDFMEILAIIKNYEVMTDFFTNGMHLTDEICHAIVESRVAAITISFSGSNKEDYENVYLKGDFETVINGIKRLDRYKKIACSSYPRIEINSLAFNHHVASLPEFVRLMADAGANVIHVKPLTLYTSIPFLKPFIAPFRPDVEGVKVNEAASVARECGVFFSTEVFERTACVTDSNFDNFADLRTLGAKNNFEERFSGLRIDSITEIKALSEKLSGVIKPSQVRKPPKARAKPMPQSLKSHDVTTPCLEPFKTIYVQVNGDVKPCCFASADNFGLGNAYDDGMNVWSNAPFMQIRNGILNSQYPKMCESCIKTGSAPTNHDIYSAIREYSDWYREVFGTTFHSHIESARQNPVNKARFRLLEFFRTFWHKRRNSSVLNKAFGRQFPVIRNNSEIVTTWRQKLTEGALENPSETAAQEKQSNDKGMLNAKDDVAVNGQGNTHGRAGRRVSLNKHCWVLHAAIDKIRACPPGNALFDVGGVVVLSPEADPKCTLWISDSAGNRQAKWDIESPVMANSYPQGTNRRRSRFNIERVDMRPGEVVYLFLKGEKGDRVDLGKLLTTGNQA